MNNIIQFLIRNKKIVVQVCLTLAQYIYKNRKKIKENVTKYFNKRKSE
jgi:hypothetical protein